jgi:hypothetical protein
VSWFALNDEERREWRQHPASLAYFEELRRQIAADRDDVVTSVIHGDVDAINNARRMAGRVDGFEAAIRIMETDK